MFANWLTHFTISDTTGVEITFVSIKPFRKNKVKAAWQISFHRDWFNTFFSYSKLKKMYSFTKIVFLSLTWLINQFKRRISTQLKYSQHPQKVLWSNATKSNNVSKGLLQLKSRVHMLLITLVCAIQCNYWCSNTWWNSLSH